MAKKKATQAPEPAPAKTWSETITIDVEMTDQEAAERARDLRERRDDFNEFQEKANRTRKLLDTRAKAIKAGIEAVETEVVTGRTPREVECTATLRKATAAEGRHFHYGAVEVRRDDTGELVETRQAQYGEVQGVLGFGYNEEDDDDPTDEDDDQ
jgi:hypothetical protein